MLLREYHKTGRTAAEVAGLSTSLLEKVSPGLLRHRAGSDVASGRCRNCLPGLGLDLSTHSSAHMALSLEFAS